MSKRILITQSNYIPWKGYFDNIAQCDEMVIYDDMQYTRRDWRNRNRIKTPQGLQWLTVPVEVKGKYHQKINETLVSDKSWGENHLKQIVQNYRKAPFFETFIHHFEELYKSEETNLSRINQTFLERINDVLGIETKILRSEEFELQEDKTGRLVDICIERGAMEYLTGPAAKAYMDEAKFEEKGIRVVYSDYSGYGEYPQLYGAFEHGVTILDAIFNVGSDLKRILKGKE